MSRGLAKRLAVSFDRDPQRAVPAVELPTLAELGVDDVVGATARLRWLFATRPFVAAAAVVVSWLAGWWPLSLAVMPLLYGWTLSAIHHLIHGSLGFGPRSRTTLMTVLSLLLLESAHALERTHRQHHESDPDADDPEGYIESLGLARLLVEAPLFRYRLWWWATGHSRPDRLRRLEMGWHLALTGAALPLAVGHLSGDIGGRATSCLVFYVGCQHLANAVFAVLAARGPHTNWGRPTPTPLIAVRGRLVGMFLFGHIWHLEHHFYPSVPLPRLRPVAAAIEPVLADQHVLIVTTP